MKGNEQIIQHLNLRLSEELAAINQYIVHAEMCENWGFSRLHDISRKRSIAEMIHAEKLIERILFLEGRPMVSNMAEIHIGSEVPKMHHNDHASEAGAIRGYNESIKLASELGDNGTRDLLNCILKEEEEHLDVLETHIEQIEMLGLQNYLSEQMRK